MNPADPDPRPSTHMSSPYRNLRYLGPAESAGLVFGFLMHAAARGLTADEYGRFASLIVIEGLLRIGVAGGLPQALRRLVGIHGGNLAEALRWTLSVQAPIACGVALLLALGSDPLGGPARRPGARRSPGPAQPQRPRPVRPDRTLPGDHQRIKKMAHDGMALG